MIWLWLILNLGFAQTPISAVRASHEDYKNYLQRAAQRAPEDIETVLSARKDLSEAPWNHMTESPIDPLLLQALFEDIRDHLPLKDSKRRTRRLTWLYPDDGCYARSALAQLRLKTHAVTHFQQIFIFGNLVADTANHPAGEVTWWYHVVPIVRTSLGVFVFDPAIDPSHPLLIDYWIDRIAPDREDTKVSLCSSSSYGPESVCRSEAPIESDRALDDEQMEFLDREWNRLLRLGRNPVKELGEAPPWASTWSWSAAWTFNVATNRLTQSILPRSFYD